MIRIPILEAVRRRGDTGPMEYAKKFDAPDRKSVRIQAFELDEAATRLTPREWRASLLAGRVAKEIERRRATVSTSPARAEGLEAHGRSVEVRLAD